MKKDYIVYIILGVALFLFVFSRKKQRTLQKTGGCGCQKNNPIPTNPGYEHNGKMDKEDIEKEKEANITSVYEK